MTQEPSSFPVLLVLLLVLGSASLSEAQTGTMAPYTCFFNECAASKANQHNLKALGDCLKSGRQPQTAACARTDPPACRMWLNMLAACCPCLQTSQLQPPRLSCLDRLHSQRPKSESLLLIASDRTLP